VGAKFDSVDVVTIEDMEEMTLAEVLTNAITDRGAYRSTCSRTTIENPLTE
jgi:hypothetical protein